MELRPSGAGFDAFDEELARAIGVGASWSNIDSRRRAITFDTRVGIGGQAGDEISTVSVNAIKTPGNI